MHETNAEPAGSRPRGWLPAWTRRPDTPSLAFTRPTPAKWILSALRLIGVLSFVAVAGMFVIAAVVILPSLVVLDASSALAAAAAAASSSGSRG